MSDLKQKSCAPCEGIGGALGKEQINVLKPQLSDAWVVSDDLKSIHREFSFNNFHETMAFMNAIAWIAHQENHHPDVNLGYKTCDVHFMTHAVDGLTQNDFICAAKIDNLTQI